MLGVEVRDRTLRAGFEARRKGLVEMMRQG